MAIGDAANAPDDAAGAAAGGGAGGAGGGGPPGLGGQPPGGVFAALSRAQQQPEPTAPGQGDQGDGLMMLKVAIDAMAKAMPSLNGTPAFAAVADALKRLSKHVPGGAPMVGAQQTFMRDLLRAIGRNPIQQQLAQMQGQQPGQQQPPNPQTPLPGA